MTNRILGLMTPHDKLNNHQNVGGVLNYANNIMNQDVITQNRKDKTIHTPFDSTSFVHGVTNMLNNNHTRDELSHFLKVYETNSQHEHKNLKTDKRGNFYHIE
jgi:ribosomal protein L13